MSPRMGRHDNRLSMKMRRKKRQTKLKARLKRKAGAQKAARTPSTAAKSRPKKSAPKE